VKKINNGMKISETDAKTNAPALQTIGTATWTDSNLQLQHSGLKIQNSYKWLHISRQMQWLG
jgi:hypothetical protein